MKKSNIVIEQFESKVLINNPMGDPITRPLPIYLPKDYDENHQAYPLVMMLTGYAARGLRFFNDDLFSENIQQRIDRLIEEGIIKPMIFVFPDASTRLGGSQYINSIGTGNYQDYLLEIVSHLDANYRTIANPNFRAITGSSSGGFGAFHMCINHPDIFSLIADHSGDKFFEMSFLPDIPHFLRFYEKFGDDGIFKIIENPGKMLAKGTSFYAIMTVAMATCYSPNPNHKFGFDFPFDLHTGEIIPEIWSQWKSYDPVNLINANKEALSSLKLFYFECGKEDEYNLLYGARIMDKKLTTAGITHIYEEFEGGHRKLDYRFDTSLKIISDTFDKLKK